MHNGHEWVQEIRQEVYVPITCQSRSRSIRVPISRNCKRPISSQSLHQLEQSSVDMQGPWIHGVVSLPVHVRKPNSIRNKALQTRQRVSSHQQSNIDVDGPR
ncbi:uncharacterized protein TNCV_1511461 [Trichonephila clavipes]|nr:uncharacterized protein TNCV_1511461 [Trichonephila clavipes]